VHYSFESIVCVDRTPREVGEGRSPPAIAVGMACLVRIQVLAHLVAGGVGSSDASPSRARRAADGDRLNPFYERSSALCW